MQVKELREALKALCSGPSDMMLHGFIWPYRFFHDDLNYPKGPKGCTLSHMHRVWVDCYIQY